MKNKIVIKAFFILAAAAFVLSCVMLGSRFVQAREKRVKDAELSNIYHRSNTWEEPASINSHKVIFAKELSSSVENDSANESEKSQDQFPTIQDDFVELKSINENVIGWLNVADNVDAPVVWYDNEFYLTHDFYGNADPNGTFFLNEMNSILPRDDVLLIHGHNMRNGAMFGELLKYEDYDYLKEFPLISFRTLYDAKKNVFYVPIAAFNASMEETNPEYFDVLQINFENEADGETVNEKTVRQSSDYKSYLDSIREWSLWESPADVNEDDLLLMLVTCSYEQDDGRFMLICRQLREGETPEDIEKLFEIEE